jgi:radical SAM-linked protein
MIRLRITFAKTEAMRFTSHLDLHRAWERAFRRAGLPLAYTQGFSPHPRLNLASALPLGFTGEAEVIDAWLESGIPASQVIEQLRGTLPPGISLKTGEEVDLSLPALQGILTANEYSIILLDPLDALEVKVDQLLTAESIPRERRGRSYDLRPLIITIRILVPSIDGQQRLLVQFSAREGATGRPEELLEALGIVSTLCRVHRTRLIFAGG